MLYVPNNAGQTHLNQLNHKALVIQTAPKVTPLNAVTAIAPLHDEGAPRDKALVAGQSYVAKVLGKPSAQHYDVMIHQQVYRIQLDKPLQVGESFQLKFLAFAESLDNKNQPLSNSQANIGATKSLQTPQFLLQQSVQDTKTAPSNPAHSNSGLNLNQQPVPSISQTGLLIQSVLASQQQLAPLLKLGDMASQPHSTIQMHLTQLPNSPVSADLIAPFLRQQLRSSGLFYESHLQQFAAGVTPLETLLEEPQNRPNADIVGLVAKQLEVFETKQMHWHGLAWPGQVMDWMVEVKPINAEQDKHSAHTETNEAQSVTSKLQLTLPNLGRIEITITYQDQRLGINIQTENATSQKSLVSQQHRLQDAFNRQNQALESLDIL